MNEFNKFNKEYVWFHNLLPQHFINALNLQAHIQRIINSHLSMFNKLFKLTLNHSLIKYYSKYIYSIGKIHI